MGSLIRARGTPTGCGSALPRRLLPAHPHVTVILAVRNEERHIVRALEAVRAQHYPVERLEILVVDGESDDRTRERVADLMTRDPRVQLLRNPARHAATGLNAALQVARGDVIVRVDGHCEVPSDYVATCVRLLRMGADCAGGPVRAEGGSIMARAIAMAMSTPLGVGGAAFRWAAVERDVDPLCDTP